jgi:hypothetical protein
MERHDHPKVQKMPSAKERHDHPKVTVQKMVSGVWDFVFGELATIGLVSRSMRTSTLGRLNCLLER